MISYGYHFFFHAILYFQCNTYVLVSHILKVPFEGSEGSGMVYIWIGGETTQEEAIHAEQMGRSMFEVHTISANLYLVILLTYLHNKLLKKAFRLC